MWFQFPSLVKVVWRGSSLVSKGFHPWNTLGPSLFCLFVCVWFDSLLELWWKKSLINSFESRWRPSAHALWCYWWIHMNQTSLEVFITRKWTDMYQLGVSCLNCWTALLDRLWGALLHWDTHHFSGAWLKLSVLGIKTDTTLPMSASGFPNS